MPVALIVKDYKHNTYKSKRNYMKTIKVLTFIVASLITSFSALAGNYYKDVPTISYINYQSEDLQNPGNFFTISGQLRIPKVTDESEKLPAVILLHGSSGVDSRGSFYAEALNAAGIATFEIDMWGARDISGGENRPALPTLTIPDAFNALALLAENPAIDSDRIAVLGFSWGGVVSMLAANESYTQQFGKGNSFAAFVAHYPICWAYNIGIPGITFEDLTDAPLLIQVGSLDDYDEGGATCQNLVASLPIAQQENVQVKVYNHSHHAWDRLEAPVVVEDSFSHLGQGGEVDIAPNKYAAKKSRKKVLKFMKKAFAQ